MDIAELLIRRKEAIFSKVSQESVDVYNWICHAYPERIDENVFRFLYRSFYRLDNAGLREDFKLAYFELLKSREMNLRKILEQLHQYPTLRGRESYQLSFATKLVHTIDNNSPIYDSLVAGVLRFPQKKAKGNRLDWCLKTFALLDKEYDTLLKDERVKPLIAEFKQHYYADTISDAKTIDFLLWGLGRLKRDVNCPR